MYKIFLLFALLWSMPLQAQLAETDGYMPAQVMPEYLEEDRTNYDKSIIYIFFNNEPCYTCASAIAMLESFYNQNFIDEYNLFLINYQNDNETDFIDMYGLSEPLEVVLVRVDDGGAFGYRKLTNLQDMISDPVSMEDYFVQQVDNFLEN